MQRRSIVTTFILPAILIFSVIILLINNQHELPGELVLAQEKIDFGELPEWEGSVTRAVTARNVGKSPVIIGRIQPGARYVSIKGPQSIPPGGEDVFQVTLNPHRLPDDAKASTAVIFTDSRRTPQVYLTVVAAAKRFATLSATICDFGEVTRNTVHEKKVKLCVNAPMNQEEIQLMPPSHSMLQWRLESDASSRCFIIRVTLGPVKQAGLFSSVLTITFPNGRTLPLSVAAKGVHRVRVQPETLFYGTVASGAEPIAEFSLTAEQPFKIVEIQTPTGLSVASKTDNVPGNQTMMKVIWHTANTSSILRDEIQVLTDVEKEPLRIPVYGLIQASDKSIETEEQGETSE